jgi:hypothetical protein
MSNTCLQLGPVAFRDFEVPAKINFGGHQRLVVHTLAGGRRVVDAIGPDDADVEFSGILSGPEATERAILLDSLRVSGSILSLRWDKFLFSVIVRTFRAEFQNNFWISFDICCTVVNGSQLDNSVLPTTGSTLIRSDVQSLSLLGTINGIDSSSAQIIVEAPNSCTQGTAASLAALTAANTALASVKTRLQSVDSKLSNICSPDIEDARVQIIQLAEIVGLSHSAWQVRTAVGYWGRISHNILNSTL